MNRQIDTPHALCSFYYPQFLLFIELFKHKRGCRGEAERERREQACSHRIGNNKYCFIAMCPRAIKVKKKAETYEYLDSSATLLSLTLLNSKNCHLWKGEDRACFQEITQVLTQPFCLNICDIWSKTENRVQVSVLLKSKYGSIRRKRDVEVICKRGYGRTKK